MSRRVAVITGAGRGIGRASALALARGGDAVVVAARTESEIAETAETIRRMGGQAEAIVADVARDLEIARIFERAATRFGRVTLLVNNAGTLAPASFEWVSVADLDHTLAVNVRAAFLCAQFAFRDMMSTAGGGCIVNIASLSGVAGVEKFPGLSAYVVAKFGIVGLTEALAVEGRPYGIRAIGLAPGAVDTALLKAALPNVRAGVSAEQVAELIVFLASDAAASLNGLTLPLLSNR